MNQPTQNAKGITLTAQQLQELRKYLGAQPHDIVNPVLTFLAQLEAQVAQEEAAKENTKSYQNVEATETVTGKNLKKVKQ